MKLANREMMLQHLIYKMDTDFYKRYSDKRQDQYLAVSTQLQKELGKLNPYLGMSDIDFFFEGPIQRALRRPWPKKQRAK